VLRAFVDGDAHLIQDVSTDPFIPLITSAQDVPDIEAAHAFIHRQQARLDDHAGYSFAIADSASNEAIGQIGLWLPDPMQGRVSIGYWVAARHRGRGIAKHALALISTWGLGLPGVHRLELYVEPWNQASGVPPSGSDTSARACFAAGRPSAKSAATCTCTHCFRAIGRNTNRNGIGNRDTGQG
jgi:ribosomal-protein-alanine N-acetyltransferase